MTLADRLLVLATTLVVVAAIAQVSTRGWPAPPRAVDESCARPCDVDRIVWVGDVLLADAAQPLLDQHGHTWPFAHVRPLLDGEVVIGNAEGPITTRREQYFPTERWHYNAQPAAARALADVGFYALGLSNNHALDRGPEGLRDTLEHLRAAGVRPFGAGMTAAEASAPLLVETRYGTVAVLGFSERWGFGAVAGATQAGTIPFSDEAIVRLKASAIEAGARWVVAYVHWGENYAIVTPRQRHLAAAFAQAGYDLVVGHHSHLAQEVDVVAGMPVIYSLGNFVFGSIGRYSERFPGYSMVARTLLGADGLRAIELTCIVTDNEVVGFQPRPCTEAQAQALMRRLGPRVAMRGSTGVVELRGGAS